MQQNTHKTAYEILGVSQTATQDELQATLRRHVLAFHPDRVPAPQREAATASFHAIMDAYNRLRTPQARRQYDASLSAAHTGNAANNNRAKNHWLDTLLAVFWPFNLNR